MKRSRIHILIVDDDVTQGKALQETFKRAGYQATLCDSSVKAITAAQRTEFHGLFVDCMLPKMNGVDLVEEIVGLNPGHEPKTFLYSGIFKDKAFRSRTIVLDGGRTFTVEKSAIEASDPALIEHLDKHPNFERA